MRMIFGWSNVFIIVLITILNLIYIEFLILKFFFTIFIKQDKKKCSYKESSFFECFHPITIPRSPWPQQNSCHLLSPGSPALRQYSRTTHQIQPISPGAALYKIVRMRTLFKLPTNAIQRHVTLASD